MHSIATWCVWVGFAGLILAALAIDFMVLHRAGPHRVRTREALLWSLAWIGLAAVFNLGLWWWLRDTLPAAQADRVALQFLIG